MAGDELPVHPTSAGVGLLAEGSPQLQPDTTNRTFLRLNIPPANANPKKKQTSTHLFTLSFFLINPFLLLITLNTIFFLQYPNEPREAPHGFQRLGQRGGGAEDGGGSGGGCRIVRGAAQHDANANQPLPDDGAAHDIPLPPGHVPNSPRDAARLPDLVTVVGHPPGRHCRRWEHVDSGY